MQPYFVKVARPRELLCCVVPEWPLVSCAAAAGGPSSHASFAAQEPEWAPRSLWPFTSVSLPLLGLRGKMPHGP